MSKNKKKNYLIVVTEFRTRRFILAAETEAKAWKDAKEYIAIHSVVFSVKNKGDETIVRDVSEWSKESFEKLYPNHDIDELERLILTEDDS